MNKLIAVVYLTVLVGNLGLPSRAFADKRSSGGGIDCSARTSWFRKAGYGIFVHYLSQWVTDPANIHSDCAVRSWDDCVSAFDVPRFANDMKRMGAGYVVFTMYQGRRCFAAPNEALEREFGLKSTERPAKRDLVMEIADALAERGIPLMLYWTGDGGDRDDLVWKGKTGWTAPVNRPWVEKWAKVIEWSSRRYGRKVKGWWFDGCYQAAGDFRYTPELLRLYEKAARAGNPDAIVAFNNADAIPGTVVRQYVPFEDYTAGEKNHFSAIPVNGCRVGTAQWHVLTHLGKTWGGPGCRLDARHLAEYLYLVNRAGGVVSIDVAIYWDGGLDRSQVNTFAGVRDEMRRLAVKDGAGKGSKNLAFMRPARCLSLRGTPLGVQRWCEGSYIGATDGDLETDITGCFEWPWQLEVDLGEVQEVSSVRVCYGRGFATRIQVLASRNGSDWAGVAELDNDNPVETTVTFAPVEARYIRYAALAPNGSGQKGDQMSIAEIEVFGPQVPKQGWISIFNQDSSNFTLSHGDEMMNRDGVLKYLNSVICNGAFTHFFICPNAQVALFDSKTLSPSWWRFLVRENGRTSLRRDMPDGAISPRRDFMLFTNGVDVVQTYIDGCREKGVSPWLTMRMNDSHHPNNPDWWGHSQFWVEHPEYQRIGGFDFSHPEVRAYHLAFVRELLARYDVDGFECDWMRWPRPQRTQDLTVMMREIRKLVDEFARHRGHRILIGARVSSRPDSARAHAMDVVRWAKEGLVDWIVPCNFFLSVDFELPLAEWKRLVKDANPNVRVIPGADSGVVTMDEKTGKRKTRRLMAITEYREWAYRMSHQGADGVYLFNLFNYIEPGYDVRSIEPWHAILKDGLSPTAICDKPRECPKGWVYEP